MSNVDSLLLRLNKATLHWHPDVDEPWLQLLRPDVNRERYTARLLRCHGFEAPLEAACAATPRLARVFELRRLRRGHLLAQDLDALGVTAAEIAAAPVCTAITPFADAPEALGWLYLIERNTLLHDRLRRHLALRLPAVAHACAYLAMCDGTANDNWRSFGAALDRVAVRRPAIANRIVEAAHAGFACLRQWSRGWEPIERSAG